ncbi:MAG: PP2C family protein-serine/threonine phosphatase [Candidatus Eisenbacteria bacterium]|nr:PP2C family protein-serine/threonine phosphatase [Candidatus Eisenbacteria bacterium]
MPVHDSKEFYRKLDTLISKIEMGPGTDRRELLTNVIRELVERFGTELSIRNGRLYEVQGSELVLIWELGTKRNESDSLGVSMDYEPVRLLFKHRCYLFDRSTPGLDPDFENRISGGTSSVAIVVGRETEHVLAFGLVDGWERESIEFGLNTVRNVLNHTLETAYLEADLAETRLIQRSLFPASFPDFPGYDLAARVLTAESVGGDYYDFIPLDSDVLGIATGDASGHGLPAALLVRDVVTGLRMGVEKDMKITPTLRKLNQVIHRSTLSTKFVSLFYGELEDNGNLMYVNAGHIAPFVLQERGEFRLEVGGSVLGPLPEIRFKRGFMHLDRGGVLVAVSDGIVERVNPSDEEFGEDRVWEIIRSHRNCSAVDLVEAIFEASRSHGIGRWQDDATVVVVKRAP